MTEREAQREERALCEAVAEASKHLHGQDGPPSVIEGELCECVRDAMKKKSRWKDVECRGGEKLDWMVDWDPPPQGLDIAGGPEGEYRWALEAKVWHVNEQIWDAIKLASGLACHRFKRAYLLCAACPGAFEELPGKELFEYSQDPIRHGVRRLVEDNAKAWEGMVGKPKVRARPLKPPAAFTTRALIEPMSVWAWYGHEVRLMRIELPDRVKKRWFKDGWPNGVDRKEAPKKDEHGSHITSADGLCVPKQIGGESWWIKNRENITARQYEALYGLLLTRRWTDEKFRESFPPPEYGPRWWQR